MFSTINHQMTKVVMIYDNKKTCDFHWIIPIDSTLFLSLHSPTTKKCSSCPGTFHNSWSISVLKQHQHCELFHKRAHCRPSSLHSNKQHTQQHQQHQQIHSIRFGCCSTCWHCCCCCRRRSRNLEPWTENPNARIAQNQLIKRDNQRRRTFFLRWQRSVCQLLCLCFFFVCRKRFFRTNHNYRSKCHRKCPAANLRNDAAIEVSGAMECLRFQCVSMCVGFVRLVVGFAHRRLRLRVGSLGRSLSLLRSSQKRTHTNS